MAIRKKAVLLVVVLVIAMLAMVGTASATEQTYAESYVLDANGQFMHFEEVWDLTQGDLVLTYHLDMSQITQPSSWPTGWVQDALGNWLFDTTPTTDPAKYPDTYTPWIEVGMRGVGGDDFNPGPANTYQGKCGGWMTSESDDWLGSWTLDELGNVVLVDDGVATQDGDDKHSLAATSGVGEWHYDVEDADGKFGYDAGWGTVLAMFGSHDNHGLWYDRDGVDQWQATSWENSGINAGRINTKGQYDIEIVYHAINDGLGVMFARINGVMQGFYKPSWHGGGLGEDDMYPAGLSFKGDMKQMQVFAGSFAYDPAGWNYGTVTLSNISVTGTPGTADPLVPDFTATIGAGNVVSFDASATHGGMGPYTYLWDFDNDGTVDETTTTATTAHTYAAAAPYTVTLTVDPYRCKAYSVTKTVEPPKGDLTVLKFNDANGNGLFDAGEVPIPGWHIQVFDGDTLVDDGDTGADGRVTFTLPIGTYTVKEDTSDTSWTATTGDTITVTVTAEGGTYDSMYATGFDGGVARAVEVTLDPYNPPNHAQRLNPANALGAFDADQSAQQAGLLNERFFAVASQSSADFTFAEKFFNVDGVTDIDFAEVTWGAWHTEAAKVYLTGAVVDGVPYTADDGGLGVPNYYAGIVWNKVGIVGIDAATRNTIAQGYLPSGVTRTFEDNEFYTEGNYGVSGFNLPAEVDYASAITLVDITKDVYNENTIPTSLFAPSTYTTVAGTGQRVILTGIDPFTYAELGPADGNTDGYDLDAIRVHRPVAFGNQRLAVNLAVEKSGPVLAILGDPLAYTYEVTNAGPASVAPVLIDDRGTPGDTSDDKSPDPVLADGSTFNVGDKNEDGLVNPGETWQFTFSYTPVTGTGPYNTFFDNTLTNTVTVSPADDDFVDSDPSDNTDTYTLGMWTLRKEVLLYWEGINVQYSDPNTAFTIELYKLNADGVTQDSLGTFSIKESDPLELWLSDGSYYIYEVGVPDGYSPARQTWFFVENALNRRDMSIENLILFDLAIEKTGPETAVAGEVITYDYELTNAGPAAVTPVVTDDAGTPGDTSDDVAPSYVSGDENGDGKIQATETWLYTATYLVPEDAAPDTTITNVVTVHDEEGEVYEPGHWHLGGDTDPSNNTDQWTLTVLNPVIDLVKDGAWIDGDGDGLADAGEVIQYTFTVTNAGNVPLSNVTVTDAKLDAPAALQAKDTAEGTGDLNDNGKLDLDETWIFTGTHTLTQADIDANCTPEPANLEALAAGLPAQVTMKVAYPATDGEAYFPSVTITGGVLSGVYDGWCIDVDNTIANNSDYTANVYSSYDLPAGLVEKPQNMDLVNWILNQQFVYKNAGGTLGNYTYGDVQCAIWTLVDDNLSTSGLNAYSQARVDLIVDAAQANGEGYVPPCNGIVGVVLQPVSGSTIQIVAAQGIVMELLGACECDFHNEATADSDESPPDTDDADVPLPKHPSVSIVKNTVDGSKTGDGIAVLYGEPIEWTYTVTNTGNVTLTNIVVRDSDSVADIGVIAELAPGASATLKKTGTAIKGSYVNGSSADPAECPAATDGSSYTGYDPRINIVKVTVDGTEVGDGIGILAGAPVIWRYTVTNVGNVALSNVTVVDNMQGVTPERISGDTNNNNKLETTETWVYEATGTAIAGDYSNTGTASGSYTDGAGHSRTDTASDGSSYFGEDPQINIVKETLGMDGNWGDVVTVIAGTPVTWRYTVTNTGNVPLSNVDVTDNKTGVTPIYKPGDGGDGILQTTETWIYEATGMAIGGDYNNVGTASGSYTDAGGATHTATETDPSSYTGKTRVSVLKTVDGMPPSSGPELTFQLREGASMTSLGTTLETKYANVDNGGLVEFATLLLPGTYQFVELIPEGYVPSYVWGDYGVDWFRPGYEPGEGGQDQEIWVAVNFTVNADGTIDFQNGKQTVQPGDSIDIDNQTGQMPRTIGYWKNHASAKGNNGSQEPVLDRMLYKATQAGETIQIGTLLLPGGSDPDDAGDSALKATRLLNKSSVTTNKKKASDPCWNLAAQLMGYRLNQPFGAWMNPTADLAATTAQAMLVNANFNGETYNKFSKNKTTLAQWTANMNYLAWVLDAYNNGTLQLGQALVMPYPNVGY